MTISNAMNVSTSGLSLERFRMDTIAANIANANSTKVGGQDPYRRKDVVVQSTANGPQVAQVLDDPTAFPMKYDPATPMRMRAKRGDLQRSAGHEMVDMMSASRAYEANIAAFNTEKGMIKSALTIGKV